MKLQGHATVSLNTNLFYDIRTYTVHVCVIVLYIFYIITHVSTFVFFSKIEDFLMETMIHLNVNNNIWTGIYSCNSKICGILKSI